LLVEQVQTEESCEEGVSQQLEEATEEVDELEAEEAEIQQVQEPIVVEKKSRRPASRNLKKADQLAEDDEQNLPPKKSLQIFMDGEPVQLTEEAITASIVKL
jgi:hypothetical protein